MNRIEELQSEYENQINLFSKIKNGEIQQLQKIISSLEKELKSNMNQNNINEQNKFNQDNNNNQYSLFIIEQISGFELKIKELNELVFNLQKEN